MNQSERLSIQQLLTQKSDKVNTSRIINNSTNVQPQDMKVSFSAVQPTLKLFNQLPLPPSPSPSPSPPLSLSPSLPMELVNPINVTPTVGSPLTRHLRQ